jgi:long-chain fatty acid transport protein
MPRTSATASASATRLWLGVAIAVLAFARIEPRSAQAGVNTYADIFPGDRAAGLAGAYVALSDDGSGAYYNPAGLVQIGFADVSLSASAYQYQSLTADGAFFGRDWTRQGGLFVPTSFGAIRRFGDIAVGLSIAVPEAYDLRTSKVYRAVDFSDFQFDLDHDFKDLGQTYDVGPTFAWAVTPELSVGATVYYVYGTRDRSSFFKITDSTDPAFVPGVSFVTSEETVTGFTASLGVKWEPDPCWSLGLRLRPPADLHHFRKEQDSEFLGVTDPLGLIPTFDTPVILNKGFTEGVPGNATLGAAWTPNDELTVALDVSYYLEEDFPGFVTPVRREPTWNVSAGAEYYVHPQVPLRLGFYTNNSSAPDPKPGTSSQREQTDFYGFTVGANWVSEHSELGLGVRQGFAVGKIVAVSIDSVAPVSDVHGTETAVFLASRYKF